VLPRSLSLETAQAEKHKKESEWDKPTVELHGPIRGSTAANTGSSAFDATMQGRCNDQGDQAKAIEEQDAFPIHIGAEVN
jgi:hypothetical protein